MTRKLSKHRYLELAAGWTSQEIQNFLMCSNKAVERALIVLYERQTAYEQTVKETKDHNDRGFTQADALFMTRMAQHVARGRHLSCSMLASLRSPWNLRTKSSRIGKYHRQLLEAVVEKRKHQKGEGNESRVQAA